MLLITHLKAHTDKLLCDFYFPLPHSAGNDELEATRQAKCAERGRAGAHKPKQQDGPFTASMDGWLYF